MLDILIVIVAVVGALALLAIFTPSHDIHTDPIVGWWRAHWRREDHDDWR